MLMWGSLDVPVRGLGVVLAGMLAVRGLQVPECAAIGVGLRTQRSGTAHWTLLRGDPGDNVPRASI